MNDRMQLRIAIMRKIAESKNPTSNDDFTPEIALEMLSLLKAAISMSADFFEKELIAVEDDLNHANAYHKAAMDNLARAEKAEKRVKELENLLESRSFL